jgi:hypothetical protein
MVGIRSLDTSRNNSIREPLLELIPPPSKQPAQNWLLENLSAMTEP